MAVVAFLVVAGGTGLVALVGWANRFEPPHQVAFLIGAFLAGLTMRRLAARGAILLASASTFVWIAVHLVVAKPWLAFPTEDYAYLLAGAPLVAALAAAIPLPFGRETRWRSLWLSALLTLGCYAAPATFGVWRGSPSGVETLAGVCGLMLAGGLTQYLATHRRVWSCGGGGALIYALALLERADNPRYVVALMCAGVLPLFGAAGAALAWSWFRGRDPREPALPTATTVT